MMEVNKTYNCDWKKGLKTLPKQSIDMVVTSPPYYGLRQYLFDGAVILKSNLSEEELKYITKELQRYNIKPKIGENSGIPKE